jgi:hypothetical protein
MDDTNPRKQWTRPFLNNRKHVPTFLSRRIWTRPGRESKWQMPTSPVGIPFTDQAWLGPPEPSDGDLMQPTVKSGTDVGSAKWRPNYIGSHHVTGRNQVEQLFFLIILRDRVVAAGFALIISNENDAHKLLP